MTWAVSIQLKLMYTFTDATVLSLAEPFLNMKTGRHLVVTAVPYIMAYLDKYPNILLLRFRIDRVLLSQSSKYQRVWVEGLRVSSFSRCITGGSFQDIRVRFGRWKKRYIYPASPSG